MFVLAGLVAAAALVIFVSPRASSSPDGLEKVAADSGINAGEQSHALAGSPFADYGVAAGLVGIVATFAIGTGLVWLVRRGR